MTYQAISIVGYLMPNSYLYILTVLFQTIKFSISTQFSSIWPIDRTISDATSPDLGAMAMNEYSVFPKAPSLLEPHHQFV